MLHTCSHSARMLFLLLSITGLNWVDVTHKSIGSNLSLQTKSHSLSWGVSPLAWNAFTINLAGQGLIFSFSFSHLTTYRQNLQWTFTTFQMSFWATFSPSFRFWTKFRAASSASESRLLPKFHFLRSKWCTRLTPKVSASSDFQASWARRKKLNSPKHPEIT